MFHFEMLENLRFFSIRYCGENQVNDIKATWSNLTKQPDVKEATVIKIQWNHLIFDFL